MLRDGFTAGPSGRTLLHLACMYGSVRCLHLLLSSDQHRSQINVVDNTNQRCSPLLLAVKHGASVIRLLLDHGASVKFTTADYQCTALHLAASRESYAAIQYRGFVPLDFVDVVKLLTAAECPVNAVDLCGETALSLLCAHVQSEVTLPVNNCDASRVRYEIPVHREILLDATRVLLNAGASASGEGSHSLPLGVLAQQMQVLLGLLAQSDEPIAAAEEALLTCREMFVLVLSYCHDTLNGWQPERVAVNLVDMLCQFAKRALVTVANYDGDFVDKIIVVVSDVFRLLLLLGAASDVIQLTSAISKCIEVCDERFEHLLVMLLNVVHETSCWHVKVYLQSHLSSTNNEMKQVILERHAGPRTLMQLCRVSILSCFTPISRVRNVLSLQLPQRLADYLLLLTD